MSDELLVVQISKIVEGGQGLGELPGGKKVFVWNALPGEKLQARLIKQKHSYAEAVAEEIILPSDERIEPAEATYLATSPWQMMTFKAENAYKKQLTDDIFHQAKVPIPDFQLLADDEKRAFHYRNKMEYSFWGDDDGLHLALHQRASHSKQAVQGSMLAMPCIDAAAHAVCAQLASLNIRAGDLKTIIVRTSQEGDTVASLFVKLDSFPSLVLPDELKGLRVYYSNPKSPASVRTGLLQELGNVVLTDRLLGRGFLYDVDSFFQVNVPIYERALRCIKERATAPELVDLYAGVGTIGLSVTTDSVELIELDTATADMAQRNAMASSLEASVIETSSEMALEHIVSGKVIILDPPRAGLHASVTARLLEVRPKKLVYLSCNPVTQARDLATLQSEYAIDYFEAYNFFPRTPHIETLAILRPAQAVN